MNWPNTHYIWAPDVMKGKDGKYYMYYCQPCQIYCGVSDTPVGPWKNILGEEEAVLVPDRYVKMSITLTGKHLWMMTAPYISIGVLGGFIPIMVAV